MRKNLAFSVVALFISTSLLAQRPAQKSAQAPAYKDAALPIAERVADLLSRMTVDEKVAQLQSFHMARPRLTHEVLSNEHKMDSIFGHGVGMMNPDFEASMQQTIERRNALQHYLKTKTRLGIPVIYIDEALHGLLAPGATVFPHSIGLASSWDTAMLRQVYDYIGKEASSKGTNIVLAPVVDVCRDPRWGRTGETYGEDPYLCGTLGSAVVEGFQGSSDGSIAKDHVAATLKHFTGHGQPEGGVNQGPANYSPRVLREFHMEPFRLCIQNAKPSAIMASYVDIDGIPSHANRWLLKDVLRKEWDFKGVVVSDWWGIDQLWQKHRVEPNEEAAALRAFNAGVTIDLPFGNNYARLTELVKEGKISMADLDTAVSYILTLKFKLGLFDNGDIDLQRAIRMSKEDEGRALARHAARECMILLKNKDHILPLQPGQYKKIAVIGPCAGVNYLGDYSGIPSHNVSILEGIRGKVGADHVLYAEGCKLTANADTISYRNYQLSGRVVWAPVEENNRLIAEAVKTAEQADIAIVAVGENEQLSREAGSPDHFGDMSTLDLQSQQEQLVEAIMATGKPVIVYLAHARPLSINWIAEHVPAIVDGWFTGEEAGNAFADILFGDTNPSGKLTISVPRSVGQIPIYYNHKPSAQFYEYVTEKNTPLFPFGYGLSYTEYTYSAPQLSAGSMSLSKDESKHGSVIVSVDVTNTGKLAGEEIVQLYIHQKVASATRPVKELKGFSRIALSPGEKKTVSFTIDAATLSYWNADMQYTVEPGVFEIMTGPSSVDTQKVDLQVN